GQYDDLRRVERDVEQVGGAEKGATRSEHGEAEDKRAENHDEEGALALDQPLQQPTRHRSADTVGGGRLRHVPASAAPCAVPPELSWYSSSPVIARSSASVSTAPIGAVRTARPRRITVTRSATSKTCASVWEMKITPRFESRRTLSINFSTFAACCGASAAAGSSMIKTRRPQIAARATATA